MSLINCPECNKEISNKVQACPHCGYPFFDEQISNSEDTQLSKTSSNKKFYTVIILILLALIVYFIFTQTSFWMTEEMKDDKIIDAYLYEGQTAATELIYKYYGTSDKAISRMMLFSSETNKKSNNDIIYEIKITEKSLKKDGNYFYFDATIMNKSSETVSYVEVDIFLLDKDNNIINSEWTNWSGTLPSGGSTKLDTIIDYDENVTNYRTSVSDVSIK